MSALNIPVLLGTGRKDRRSDAPARYVHQAALEYGFESVLVDPRDHLTSPFTVRLSDAGGTSEWEQIMLKSDGLVIVSPEYNHSFPGELKLMLDHLYPQYEKKPVAIFGVSGGGLGGARMIESLHQVVIALKMIPTRNSVMFQNVAELFDDKGEILDDVYQARITGAFEELAWYANACKSQK